MRASISAVKSSLVTTLSAPSSIYAECHQGKLTCYQAHALNSSIVLDSCPAHASERRLPAKDPCELDGKRISGIQYLNDDPPHRLGSYFAFCDEGTNPPTLSCFMDGGVLDTEEPKLEVKCSEATAKRRRLGTYDANIDSRRRRNPGDGGLWPKGVLCWYAASVPAAFVTNHLGPVFREYEKNTCLKFKHILNECDPKAGECNGCRHFIDVNIPTNDECSSFVGYERAMDSTFRKLSNKIQEIKLGQKQYTSQSLKLAPRCHHTRDVSHEFGHAIGLLHDHQRFDRGVILALDLLDQPHHSHAVRATFAMNYAIEPFS